MAGELELELGVKTDPIEYRYSFEWLFGLLQRLKVRHIQLGTFFELYQLPDAYFRDLRRRAEDHEISITSLATSHRELGGFFRDDGTGWEQVARRNFERLIEVASLLGASNAGTNAGSILRDRMGTKPAGLRTWLRHMKELLHVAKRQGVKWLTIQPMSCLAEPPAVPDEIRAVAEELHGYHMSHPHETAEAGYCVDVAHGYTDAAGKVRFDHIQILEAALPYACELHLKNTDESYQSTFGFTPLERHKGIVNVEQIRDMLAQQRSLLPVKRLIGYLEITGPKLGREHCDSELEEQLAGSVTYLQQTFTMAAQRPASPPAAQTLKSLRPITIEEPRRTVQIAPCMMHADLCHLEDYVRRLEAAGADLLHFDVMDYHFSPGMPLGLNTLEQLRPKTDRPFDVHLMVENNDAFIQELARIGVQQISVHAESATHLDRTLGIIRENGIKAGVAISPATPLSVLNYVMESLDFVLLMNVTPGYSPQKQAASSMRKIADCRELIESHGRRVLIEVDGYVSFENIPQIVTAGADILVAGSASLFHRGGSLRENMSRIQNAVLEAAERK